MPQVEAACAPNGVGIVKLMGRRAGFIAAHAVLSEGDADLCLIPEVWAGRPKNWLKFTYVLPTSATCAPT